MIISLLVLAIVFIGFVYIESPLFLLFLSILRGVSTSFFNTISKALIGDLTPEDQRFRVFSTRYSAMNLGFSIGPMVGAFLGIGGSSITFLLTSSVYLVYSIILVFLFQSFSVQQNTELNAERIGLAQAWNVVRSDKVLFFFILGGIMLTTVHGQISVPLSQYLKENIVDGVKLFGLLMSINGVTVIILQVPLTRWSEKFSIFHRIILGSSLLTLGAVGFAFSAGWAGFILSMIIFTLAEILLVPAEYTQIDQITPHGMRGTYYGAQSFSEFGNFLGPWIGGILLSAYGGTTMFLTLGAISIASLFFFSKGRKLVRR
ncbi:MFS transporter [Bacillus atrophaeus]|nr:MFS transporter [Bacillus atrophaeus]